MNDLYEIAECIADNWINGNLTHASGLLLANVDAIYNISNIIEQENYMSIDCLLDLYKFSLTKS